MLLFADAAAGPDVQVLYQALSVFATALVMAAATWLRQWAHDRRQAALAADTNTTVKQVHGIVNGRMLAQLQINADLARKLADATKDPADLAKAKDAADALAAHRAKLREVYGSVPPAPVAPVTPPAIGRSTPPPPMP